MSRCNQCGKQNPESLGSKPRKYCSKKCAQKFYHQNTYTKKHKNWGTKTDKRMQEVEDRKAQFKWHQTNMYTIKRIEEDFGVLRSTAWYRAMYLGIEGKVIVGGPNGGKHKFFTFEEVQRILHEAITPEHGSEWARENRKKARIRGRNATPEQKKAKNKRAIESRQKRKAKDPAYRLRVNVSALVYDALVRKQGLTKGGSTFAHLPYTPSELKEHIEKQFNEHMDWDNYGVYWNIDHIIPQAALIYDSLTHPNFQKCWALNNLRPLEVKLNSSKGSFYKGKRHNYSK
mgnify:CR=1 FL=1|tara:strand:- start:5793 stop:6653 length:861 start_codon:yes stop_codon:yes gene_type:complete